MKASPHYEFQAIKSGGYILWRVTPSESGQAGSTYESVGYATTMEQALKLLPGATERLM